jgi:putative phage-type endonuclease
MYCNDLECLENIIDNILPPTDELFINDENMSSEFIETTLELIYDYINENPTLISEPDFHEICVDEICNLFLTQFEEHNLLNYQFEDNLYNLVEEVFEILYSSFFPRRSFNDSIILFEPNTSVINNKLLELICQPQYIQRTPEWYNFRHTLITASNAYKIFDSVCSQNQLIYEKCQPILIKSDEMIVNTNSSLHWGQKYEPVSLMFYIDKYDTEIMDFGCLTHTKYNFLGASPDGINIKKQSQRYGRMLEIKNIVNRVIDGIPKKEYWIQMQLQMEICNLDECDFLETQFIEYDNEQLFINDGSEFITTASGEMKGIIMYFSDANGVPIYIYKPLRMCKLNFDIWEMEQMNKYSELTWIKNIYWKLEKYSCVLVLRNNIWFKNNIMEMQQFWNIILNERNVGCQHRAPTKKMKKEEKELNINGNNCLLTINKDTQKVSIIQNNIIIKVDTDVL